MTVAIPIFGSRVSPRFDRAPSMLLATVEEGRVVRRETVSTADRNPLARIGWLCQQQAGVVICGGISGFSIRLLADRGIQVFPWVWGAVDDVLQLFVSGRMKPGLIIEPGGRGRRCRCRGRRWHSGGSGDGPQRQS